MKYSIKAENLNVGDVIEVEYIPTQVTTVSEYIGSYEDEDGYTVYSFRDILNTNPEDEFVTEWKNTEDNFFVNKVLFNSNNEYVFAEDVIEKFPVYKFS